MICYTLTDGRGNSEKLRLISNENNVLKFEGNDSILNIRSGKNGVVKLYRDNSEVRVSIELNVGSVTKMKIYDKSHNLYVDCQVKAKRVDIGGTGDIFIEYDMLNGEEIADSISVKIGVENDN